MNNEDRRREPRIPATGQLSVFLEDPVTQEIRGELVDISRGGFRAAHDYPGFHSGQQVRFRHPMSEGRARVIWNRITSARVETGFLVM